ncbi:MAG: STAS domain-containing protein [Beutenbergiaceae bacterium]
MGSSTSRTAAMDQAGSRTQLPSLVLAGGTLLLLAFGTAVLAHVPSPAIGAIVAVAVLPLLGVADLRRLWRIDRFEFAIAAACFVVTLLVGAIAGIVVAFVLALINLARRAADPEIDVMVLDGDQVRAAGPGSVTGPGLIIVRMVAPLFFANADTFAEKVRGWVLDNDITKVVVDLGSVTDVDVTGAESFLALRQWLDEHDVSIGFSRVRRSAAQRLRHLGIVEPQGRIYYSNADALAALVDDPDRQHEPDH